MEEMSDRCYQANFPDADERQVFIGQQYTNTSI